MKFSGSKRTVIDGPFTETKELIAGFWLWQVKSRDEAIEWVKQIPNPMPGTETEVEFRPPTYLLPAPTRAGDLDQVIGSAADRRRASRLHGPGPAADRYSQMKQKTTAGTPPLSTGQIPCGACPMK